MRPSFRITDEIVRLNGEVMRLVGRYEGLRAPRPQPLLRRKNRIRTIHASLAIEGNPLTERQVTAVLDGKRVVAEPRALREVTNAVQAYAQSSDWKPWIVRDLLAAHRALMTGLIPDAGRWRGGGVGVFSGGRVIHVAPPADRVEHLVAQLFRFLRQDPAPWLVKSAVAHYELQFIHPFSDGNGRVGRLWQHVVLQQVSPLFAHVPFESIVRRQQQAYYRALRECDRAGDCTAFVVQALGWLEEGLRETLAEIRPARDEQTPRLAQARAALKRTWFSRKNYLALFPGLSTATASRDLASAVSSRAVVTRGVGALRRYRFR